MKSVYNFVVKPKGKRYNNTKKVGDSELIVNTEIFNHQYTNREAVVISTPIVGDTRIKPGDTVMFIKDADYEMEVEGEKLYRMRNQDILAKVDKDSLPEAVETIHKDNHQADLPSFDEYNKKMQ